MAFLSRSLSHAPGGLALQDPEGSSSYRELGEGATSVALRLRELGVGPGDLVGLAGQADRRLVTALHGIWLAGAAAAPVNPRWTPTETRRALAKLSPRLVLVGDVSGPAADAIAGAGPDMFFVGASPGSKPPPLGGEVPVPEEVLVPPLERIFPAAATLPTPSGDRVAAHILTSGTSGDPRHVAITVANLTASAEASRERLQLSASDRWLGSLSLAHVGGLALVARAALLGSSVIFDGMFSVERFLTQVESGSVTHASLVPTMLHRVLEALPGGAARSALRCLLVGGAAAPPSLVERALSQGLPIALTYGLTEATSQVATAPPALVRRKPGTVGPPIAGVSLRIAEDGEILVRGATVAPGEASEDGWLRTADLGRQDGDGHLWVTGRRSERIISGGVNVDPVEVENVLRTHASVLDAVVVGIPDEEWGERVVAAVVANPAADPPGPQLVEWIRSGLSAAKRPREIRLVERIPLNANGKVDRMRVRDFFPVASRRQS